MVKIVIRIYQILQHWYTQKKLINCVAIFTILYGNYYPPYGEFELICKGKFARRTWVNFTHQYGKNQRCQEKTSYYAVWQLLLYYYREFPSKILSVRKSGHRKIFVWFVWKIRFYLKNKFESDKNCHLQLNV